MSSTFLAIFLITLVMLIFWRVVLIAILAFVLAMFLTGVDALFAHADQPPAPASTGVVHDQDQNLHCQPPPPR